MIIKHATIKFSIPVKCDSCKRAQDSSTKTIEAGYCTIEYLETLLRIVEVGKDFPEGWASFFRNGITVYICPHCLNKPSFH